MSKHEDIKIVVLLFLFILDCVLIHVDSAKPKRIIDCRTEYNVTVFDKDNEFYQIAPKIRSYYDTQAFDNDNAYTNLHKQLKYKNVASDWCQQSFADQHNSKKPYSIRILSFNVHNWHQTCFVDTKRLRKDPSIAINSLKLAVNATDIVLFQEYVPYVDDLTLQHKVESLSNIRISMKNIHLLMTQEFGMSNHIYMNDFEHGFGNCNGKAAMSDFVGKAMYWTRNEDKLKVTNTYGKILNKDRGDRSALHAEISLFNRYKVVLLYNVHLSFGRHEETLHELKTLTMKIKRDMASRKTEYAIIMGDFNQCAFRKNNDVFEPWKQFNEQNDISFTMLTKKEKIAYTAYNQFAFIDLIFVSENFNQDFVSKTEIFQSPASDHYPISLLFRPRKEPDTIHSATEIPRAQMPQMQQPKQTTQIPTQNTEVPTQMRIQPSTRSIPTKAKLTSQQPTYSMRGSIPETTLIEQPTLNTTILEPETTTNESTNQSCSQHTDDIDIDNTKTYHPDNTVMIVILVFVSILGVVSIVFAIYIHKRHSVAKTNVKKCKESIH